jgi:hypothetical protein
MNIILLNYAFIFFGQALSSTGVGELTDEQKEDLYRKDADLPVRKRNYRWSTLKMDGLGDSLIFLQYNRYIKYIFLIRKRRTIWMDLRRSILKEN